MSTADEKKKHTRPQTGTGNAGVDAARRGGGGLTMPVPTLSEAAGVGVAHASRTKDYFDERILRSNYT